MSEPANVLVVAHQTAATAPLLEAVRERARRSPASFHLVVPSRPHGLDKLMDPADHGQDEATRAMQDALPKLSSAAGSEVTGEVGDSEPLMAIQDALTAGDYDEIIISTLPLGISRWLRLDVISKARALGPPVSHVLAPSKEKAAAGV
ncbi:MAG TPA: hypothetical protein VGF81_06375 [Solirubrobacteraceae bacterium]|jgi:hypothetical protein